MIVLKHDSEPVELTNFLAANNNLKVADFDSLSFRPVKRIVRQKLYDLQGNLCVYCERSFTDINKIQVEHIKPKSGPHKHPHLCFSYTNYAASCIQQKNKNLLSCGQKKQDKVLPIEPTSLQCNDNYVLNTDGEILPVPGSTRVEHHKRQSTTEILGLNKAFLVRERKLRLDNLVTIIKLNPNAASRFINAGQFRHILRRMV
ncbi:retron system putative HNH endonuclease [Vibrio cyclitrophicus]|uniref:retron system putative HNH endonuclease n=1 Tax=Vibrio cyclitrophicus TaxID=47951 RepID=UPI000C847FF2|nr:retron system putative HNH endonuclease [Vibrio cyclitrophicus]PMJ73741.1 TIGR02646 family protein [Vibrio cyclitrophicus]